jgi:DNA-binding LytR/AlgR family response regulator
MIRIAIVEDEETDASRLKEYLCQYSTESREKFDIVVFTDGDEILENYTAEFDIILLDVQMEFMDGMTAAKEIRKIDPEVVLIFVTNMAQYAIRSYSVDALDYILKPVSYFAFSQRLERAIARMKKRSQHFMTISIRDGVQKLDISKIYYVESQAHKLVFHTANSVYTSSGAMQDLEEKLKGQGFYRGNKGYLINLEYVDGMRDGCAIVNGELLLISRARKNGFLQALADYVGGVVK